MRKLKLYRISWYTSGFDCRESLVLDYNEWSAIDRLVKDRCYVYPNYRIETIDEIEMDKPQTLGHFFC